MPEHKPKFYREVKSRAAKTRLVQLAVLHIILVSALFTETSGKRPVLGVLGPQPHCASGD